MGKRIKTGQTIREVRDKNINGGCEGSIKIRVSQTNMFLFLLLLLF